MGPWSGGLGLHPSGWSTVRNRCTGGADRPTLRGMPPGPTITLAPDAAEPPYEQIRSQLTAQVASGALVPGSRLPTVRDLAATLGIAANTVARAYRELEHAGAVTTRGRAGTFVNGDGVDRAAKDAASSYAEAMRALGIGQDEALGLVRRAFGRPGSS